MRLVRKHLERDDSGYFTLSPETPEDMWHAFNLVALGDFVTASAQRRVTTSNIGAKATSKRMLMNLTIKVVKIDFDAQARQLHLNGQVSEGNEWVRTGQHHTLDLELFRNFTIGKTEWDSIAKRTIADACDPVKKAEIGAIVLSEGIANICLITEHMTILRQRVETSMPHKRTGSMKGYDKGIDRFFVTLYDTMQRHFDFEKLKVVLLASPGFTAHSFRDFALAQALKKDDKSILKAKSKFVTVHSSSGHVHALNEVLKSKAVMVQLEDAKYARETRAVEEFFDVMRNSEDRAWYGLKEVEKAITQGAVNTLLISDRLFRSEEIGIRKKWVQAFEDVKKQGGHGFVLSSVHESGNRLDALGGVAAILNWGIVDLDESDSES